MRKRLIDTAVWLGIFLCGGLLAVMLAYPALAQEIKQGHGLVCDTKEQIERYVALYKKGDDGNEVVKSVNLEVGKEAACGIIPVAYVEDEAVGQVRGEAGAAKIVRVYVVAFYTPLGWQRVPPLEQYVAIPVKEQGA